MIKAELDAETARVAGIIARDKQDRVRELDRKQADMEMAKGVFVNLSDAVIEPTPEWLAMGETKTYFPRQLDETTRVVKTVRRVVTPIVARLYRADKISEDQLRACLWYRQTHEKAGLLGRYSGSRYEDNGGASCGSIAISGGHIPMTLDEAYAREQFREARNVMDSHFLRMFDAVVIDDIPMIRAARLARCANDRIYKHFRMITNQLVVFCEANDVDLVGIGRD